MAILSFLALALFAQLGYAHQQQIPLKPASVSTIPLLGFGTWNLKGSNNSDAVSLAIQTGYSHIDCAAIYGNEKEVGKGIADGLKKAGLKREDIWVTSKLWNDHHAPHLVDKALDKTLSDLGLEYLDLYLMHWPVAHTSDGGNKIDYLPAWHAMLALPSSKVHNLGVSNFAPTQLYRLIFASGRKPTVHQMELHPYLQQRDWVAWHKANRINVTAYSPLAGSNPTYGDPDDAPPPLLKNRVMEEIAYKRNCTVAQVALEWGMGRGTSVIPKSAHADRIIENYKASTCGLLVEDLDIIEEMGKENVKRFNNPSKGWGVDLYEGLEGV